MDAQLALLERRHDDAFTIVAAPDSPWEADGLQRESAAVRQAVHELVLQALAERGIPYLLVTGSLPQRLLQATRLLDSA